MVMGTLRFYYEKDNRCGGLDPESGNARTRVFCEPQLIFQGDLEAEKLACWLRAVRGEGNQSPIVGI